MCVYNKLYVTMLIVNFSSGRLQCELYDKYFSKMSQNITSKYYVKNNCFFIFLLPYAHPLHHYNGFVATWMAGCRKFTGTGRPKPACCHKIMVVMRMSVVIRMGALDCLHDFTMYLRSLLCLLCA